MSPSNMSRNTWLDADGESMIRVVPREEVRAWCVENGVNGARIKQRHHRYSQKTSQKKSLLPRLKDKLSWLAANNTSSPKAWQSGWEKIRSINSSWHAAVAKGQPAWLIRPLQFFRERSLAFAAIAVIASWALVLYMWVVYRVK